MESKGSPGCIWKLIFALAEGLLLPCLLASLGESKKTVQRRTS
jgi:hypothetical protein